MRSIRVRIAAAIVSVVGLVVLATASPAASRGASYFTGDSRGHVDVSLSRQYIDVCDDSADNRGVFATYDWWAPNGDSGTYWYVGDGNGSSWGCGSVSLSTSNGFPSGAVIYAYRYCVRQSGSMTVAYCDEGQW